MFTTVKVLLLNPDEFFRQKVNEEVNLKVPALIVLLLGIIAAVGAIITTGPILRLLPEEVAAMSGILVGFSAVSAILFTFIIWVVFAGVFFILSMVFKGTGSFQRTLEFVGYGYPPQVIGSLITLPIMYSYFSQVNIPPVDDPAQIQEIVTEIMSAPTMQVAIVIGLLFWLWSANIWIFGVKEARRLSIRDAVITVAVPVGIYLIYQLYNIMVM